MLLNMLLVLRITNYFFLIALIFTTGCDSKRSQVPENIHEAGEMVLIKGGKFRMGNETIADASPILEQEISDFYMQKHEVTNAQFRRFVEATGYKTLAERNGGSYVFTIPFEENSLSIPNAPWWHFRPKASWKNPTGKKELKTEKDFEPAIHIAYEDACAYCDWLGARLPTEAEWEYAVTLNGEVNEKNIWQGNFPYENKAEDGFEKTSPTGSFPTGKIGLHDMNGNVWEWCADYYHENWYKIAQNLTVENRKKGAQKPYDSHALYDTVRVIRGGSYLCADNFCKGYRSFSRMRSDVNMTFGHIGFRCVKQK